MLKMTELQWFWKYFQNCFCPPSCNKLSSQGGCIGPDVKSKILYPALIYQVIQVYTWLIFSSMCCDPKLMWYSTNLNAIFIFKNSDLLHKRFASRPPKHKSNKAFLGFFFNFFPKLTLYHFLIRKKFLLGNV